MSDPVRLEQRSGVAVITINSPPVNALGAAVRKGLADAIQASLEEDSVKSIAIKAAGRTFPAGADITEFDSPVEWPELFELCNMVEASPKPVIVALHGTVLGGGLELAMAAHYRIAHQAARFGLPEVALGLLPGGGGTQRAPRLMGAEAALEIMMSGIAISAEDAKVKGLVDEIVGDDLSEVLIARAAQITQTRPTRDLRKHLKMGTEFMAQVSLWRAELGETLAHRKIVDCVEAALLVPFDAALEMEREAFYECLESSSSKGLRHAFFAERRAMKLPELRDGSALPVEEVAILGHDPQACELACGLLVAGLVVTLVAAEERGVTDALDEIGGFFQGEAKSGRISEGQGADALTHLKMTTQPVSAASAGLIIDCLEEEAAAVIWDGLGSQLQPEVVIAVNSATRDISKIGALSGHKTRALAMHFLPPARQTRAVELGITGLADPDAVATAHAVARKLGKFPVRSAAKPGLIGQTVMTACVEACDRLLLLGATPDEVDEAMREFGMQLGPYEMLDRDGVDLASARRKSRLQPVTLALLDRVAEAGWHGRKTGKGYYLYDSGSGTGKPNPDMLERLEEERIEREVRPIEIGAGQIRHEALLAMINAGAKLVDHGVALRPSDVDAVMIHGFGYPRVRGGPMHEADLLTPFEVARRIDSLAKEAPQAWEVSPLLERLARERQRFSSLNGT